MSVKLPIRTNSFVGQADEEFSNIMQTRRILEELRFISFRDLNKLILDFFRCLIDG